MNRQFRRAQEKQDKKQEKEKARRREERKSRLRQLRRSRRKEKSTSGAAAAGSGSEKTSSGESAPAKRGRGRNPGRFAGVLAAVTVFFISLQGVAPVEESRTTQESLVAAGFYLMLGYFATLWFLRREVARAPLVSVIGGTLLAGSVALVAVLQQREPDLLALALALPGLVLGALLGNLVFRVSPR